MANLYLLNQEDFDYFQGSRITYGVNNQECDVKFSSMEKNSSGGSNFSIPIPDWANINFDNLEKDKKDIKQNNSI